MLFIGKSTINHHFEKNMFVYQRIYQFSWANNQLFLYFYDNFSIAKNYQIHHHLHRIRMGSGYSRNRACSSISSCSRSCSAVALLAWETLGIREVSTVGWGESKKNDFGRSMYISICTKEIIISISFRGLILRYPKYFCFFWIFHHFVWLRHHLCVHSQVTSTHPKQLIHCSFGDCQT